LKFKKVVKILLSRDNLRVVLRQLDFEVEVYNDLPYKEIERILEQASMEDHSDADCIFVTGLTYCRQRKII
jgi:hypothetical protein